MQQTRLLINITVTSNHITLKNRIIQKTYSPPSTGTGLNNLDNRYKLLTGKNIIVYKDNEAFTVKLPLINPQGMKIFIIEDETPALENLKLCIASIDGNYEITGTATSVADSLSWLKNNTGPDLILMDIQLSDGLSFHVLKEDK